jgi:hypothetical protein
MVTVALFATDHWQLTTDPTKGAPMYRDLVCTVICLSATILFAAPSKAGQLVVHEWGTFTTLQDEDGREVTGINVDDEPVPDFVHNLNPYLLSKPILSSLHWQYRQKAAPRQHPLVTMRLETPVIYFYPPPGAPLPMDLDVSVQFRGGWLTEFYPEATASAPGLKEGLFEFGELDSTTVGSLAWDHVRIGTKESGPETTEHVWLAPRKTQSAPVTVGNESEQYLFYRGVGRLRPPLRVMTDREHNELSIRANFDKVLAPGQAATINRLWLADIREDGTSAFRTLGVMGVTADTEAVRATTQAEFDAKDYAKGNLQRLKDEMHRQLVAAGLFEDEATAMLATWDRAYFQSPGLRLFFLVPREWTDHHLPLSLTDNGKPVNTRLERVMMGRIELVSRSQRATLNRLADAAISDGKWVNQIPESPARDAFLAGRSNFGDLGVAIPPDYQLYLSLGRFRNALIVADERLRPTPSLTQFIDTYELHPYRWPSAEATDLAKAESK